MLSVRTISTASLSSVTVRRMERTTQHAYAVALRARLATYRPRYQQVTTPELVTMPSSHHAQGKRDISTLRLSARHVLERN